MDSAQTFNLVANCVFLLLQVRPPSLGCCGRGGDPGVSIEHAWNPSWIIYSFLAFPALMPNYNMFLVRRLNRSCSPLRLPLPPWLLRGIKR